jgi:beta-glucanase (GH16 family)
MKKSVWAYFIVALGAVSAAAAGEQINHTTTIASAADRESRSDSPYVPSGYEKIFSDEFDETRLDESKWWTRFIYADGMLDYLNDEDERYREHDNHVMTGHSLILMARKIDGSSDGVKYSSGMIRSKTTFKFGYFESRIKVPRGLGVWPAFWLSSGRRSSDGRLAWPPEIDFAELVNNGVEDTTHMLHMGAISHDAQALKVLYTDPNFNTQWVFWQAPYDFADGFHVFGGLWDTDNTLSVYVDGQLLYKTEYKWVYDDGSPAGYANVILNLAIGGPKWAGRHGVDNAAFPQGLEVDYVRVYQKTGQHKTEADTTGRSLCPLGDGC